MSDDEVIHKFFWDEALPAVSRILRHIDGWRDDATERSHHFEFNVFDVTIDRDANSVSLVSDLDPDARCTLTLTEFEARLRAYERDAH